MHLAWTGFELTTLVVIGTDCIGSYKSNYHTIPTMTAPTTPNYFFYLFYYHSIVFTLCMHKYININARLNNVTLNIENNYFVQLSLVVWSSRKP
jgi:hypothetical protein